MTEEHWKLIKYIRDYFYNYGVAPMVRRLLLQRHGPRPGVQAVPDPAPPRAPARSWDCPSHRLRRAASRESRASHRRAPVARGAGCLQRIAGRGRGAPARPVPQPAGSAAGCARSWRSWPANCSAAWMSRGRSSAAVRRSWPSARSRTSHRSARWSSCSRRGASCPRWRPTRRRPTWQAASTAWRSPPSVEYLHQRTRLAELRYEEQRRALGPLPYRLRAPQPAAGDG